MEISCRGGGALHARVMEIIEALSPDRLAEQIDRLAHDALQGEVWDKALPYCRQAEASLAQVKGR